MYFILWLATVSIKRKYLKQLIIYDTIIINQNNLKIIMCMSVYHLTQLRLCKM